MTYREWSPGPELAGRVACFWTSGFGPVPGGIDPGSPAPEAAPPERKAAPPDPTVAGATSGTRSPSSRPTGPVKRILPDGCMDIIWGPDGAQVAGPDTHAHLAAVRPDGRYIAVRFLPGGAGPVFGAPADAFTDLRLPLDELQHDLWRAVGEPWSGPPQGLDDLCDFQATIAAGLRAAGPGPDLSASAMRRALAGDTPVPQVARDLGFSERTLRRRSLAAFGYGPKTLQRVLRFQRALHHARQGADLADVAHACGYADQPHLAGEVRDLAGVPLTRLL